MIMNRINLLMLLLQVIEVFSSNHNVTDCGYFPVDTIKLIFGGHKIKPEKFSWLASLAYGHNNTFGICGGSVIHPLYVLTAAHCVSGGKVKEYGELTGVRLGNFTEEPFCDYGSPDCQSSLFFGIRDKIIHESYDGLFNDIALLRLNRPIVFNNHLKPICLPNDKVPEPVRNQMLTVSGWGITLTAGDQIAKRAVRIPLVTDPEFCEHQHPSRMCAGLTSNNKFGGTSCDGDSGGPLMQQFQRQKMMIEGIVSHGRGICVNAFFATQYTRVRYYLTWINEKMNLTAEHK